MNTLSWKATQKGGKRCAPACGAGCTQKKYLEAHRKARAMKNLLTNPKGWKIRVWENCGWHYEIVKGGMTVHCSENHDGNKYWTLFSSTDSGGGEMFWTPNNERFDTPDEAVHHQLELALAHIKQCNRAVDKVL